MPELSSRALKNTFNGQDEEEKNDFKEQLYYLAIPDADKKAKYAKKIFEDIFEFNAPEKEEVK